MIGMIKKTKAGQKYVSRAKVCELPNRTIIINMFTTLLESKDVGRPVTR